MLYSSSPKEILQGCGRVSAWMVKQDLPIAVEVTASLQRELHSQEKNVSALSLAVIRFINGVVEPFKNVNLAVPISTIGSSYGIPEFIINIRHSATHGKMPSFELAAHGARAALDWLKTNYWEAQLSHINQIQSDMKEHIMRFLMGGEKPFTDKPKDQVLSFGIEALIGLALNKSQKKQTISRPFQERVYELITLMHKTYGFVWFGASFAMRLAEDVAQGNDVASCWIDFLVEKQFPSNVPDKDLWFPSESIRRILSWADSTLLGKAIPMKFMASLSLTDKGSEEQALAWPPISMGRMPLSDCYLTLNDDEWEFVEPGEEMFAPLEHKTLQVDAEDEEEETKPKRVAENLLEIW